MTTNTVLTDDEVYSLWEKHCKYAGMAKFAREVEQLVLAKVQAVPSGWKEAAIAWEVCASIHRQFAKGKDALFTTRQSDFVRHAADALERAALSGESNGN